MMKVLKYILISILSVVSLALIIALFIPKEYAVEREVSINRSKTDVFEYVKLLKNQDFFSVWNQRDANMKREFVGTDGTVGAISKWDSQIEDVGKGEQEIKKITEGERVDFELRFIKPFEATDNAFFNLESFGEKQTKVKWGFNGKMPYPMNLMLLMMNMDEMLGSDLQTGLNNLKSNLEK